MSTINLVGANVVASVKTAQLEDHSSGYCRMVPIFRDVAIEYEQPVQIPVIKPKTPTDETEYIKKAITFDRGDNVVANVYEQQVQTPGIYPKTPTHEREYMNKAITFNRGDNVVANEYEQPVQIPGIHPKTSTHEPEYIIKAITFDRGDNVVDGLRMLSICTTPQNRHSGSSTENIEPLQEHPAATPKEVVYANISTKDTPLTPHNPQSIRKRLKAKNLFLCTRSPSNQNDEKYPSYYPNTSPTTPDAPKVLTTKKSPKVLLVRSHHHQTPRTENVYIATPHTKSSRKSPPAHKSSSTHKVQIKSRYRGSSNTPTSTKSVTPNELAIRNISIEIEPDPNNRHSNSKTPAKRSARESTENVAATPIPTIIDDTGSTGLAASLKRFRTLPRFRGIDFSPLKLRINNVLQRYNSDNI